MSTASQLLVTDLTDEQLNARPDSDTWSVGMQLDHITIVLEKATGEMEKALERGIPTGNATDWKPNFLERKFIQMVGAQPGGRTNPVPKGFEPSEAPLEKEMLLPRYTTAHDKLIHVVERTANADLKRIKVASAVMPLLKLSLGAWFAALANHTDYHLEKATRLKP
ncbi:DinB family protein [Armatimonas sp.]|uniref:DinB family protein n=1 Tax=Armatimonas sp. TaxID=1872638 RepID=UPI00286BBD94|nr:DinB family protein [Armatimonas sp.]